MKFVQIVALSLAVAFIGAGSWALLSVPRGAPVTPEVVALERTAPAPQQAVTFAVAGDSMTAYDNTSFPNWDGTLSPRTWTYWAISHTTQLVGGYALSGNKSFETAALMPTVDADVLVVMLGTNDAIGGYSPDSLVANIAGIINTAGARSVLVVAIPPLDYNPELAAANNVALQDFATRNGFDYIDPWAQYRDGLGWVPGASGDGTHPLTEAEFQTAGESIRNMMQAITQPVAVRSVT